MANTTYSIELSYESGRTLEFPIVAETDSAATKKMRLYVNINIRQLRDCNAFLAFRRTSDGQHGYLNRDGASPNGKAWN